MVDRQRQVIAFCGDGGFSILMGDLLTLKSYNLPVKIVVLNNSSLGFADLEMRVLMRAPCTYNDVQISNQTVVNLTES